MSNSATNFAKSWQRVQYSFSGSHVDLKNKQNSMLFHLWAVFYFAKETFLYQKDSEFRNLIYEGCHERPRAGIAKTYLLETTFIGSER